MKNFRNKALALGVVLPSLAFGISAAEVIEEVVVTGSFIKGSPEDASLPIDVISRGDLEDFGNPSILEMVQNLSVTSGNIGETNQFDSRGGQGNEGMTTINLRGLGSARTLVLFNGKRHVSTESNGVDISAIPSIAIGRLEILKDGAAALYGSDAIAGVVNFITRDNFEGVEFRASHQDIDGSDGDQSFGAIFGKRIDNVHFAVSAEYETRSELGIKDRDWALRPYSENPQGGWSAIGNPGTFWPTTGPVFSPVGAQRADPNCADLGGDDSTAFCRFQYTFFDNLIEETETYKVFGEVNVDISDTMTFHAEALYSEVDLPSWKTSPSYPPQSLFGPDRFIAPDHPGLVDMKAQNPTLFPDVVDANGAVLVPSAAQGAFGFSRMLGVEGRNGQAEEGSRNTQQTRLAGGFKGEFSTGISYDISVSWSQREREVAGSDMLVEGMAFAIDGLGGPGCDQATGTPGVGGCEYYNPFSNAIQVSAVNGATNPQYNPAVGNSDELINWLTAVPVSVATNELLVFDAIFSGESSWELGGGNVGWAAGIQTRDESFDLELNRVADRAVSPCAFNNPASVTLGNVASLDCGANGTGLTAFLAANDAQSTSRLIYGMFAEFALPVTDTFDVQLAFRYEDYGNDTGGNTFDPKVAFSWAVTDSFKVRGSASSTFRGPPGSFLTGTATSLQFLPPASAFKAVDTTGNPDLQAETAVTVNFGAIFQTEAFYGSLDYWSFDFENPFQSENANQLIAAYGSGGFDCADGGTGVGSAACDELRPRFTPLGTQPAGIARTQRFITNGADLKTSGLDFVARYTFFDVASGELEVGGEGTYTLEYESDDFRTRDGLFLATGGDLRGQLNEPTPLLPMPGMQGNLFAKWRTEGHRVNYAMRYITSYEDSIPGIPSLANIDSQLTHDIHYVNNMFDQWTLSLSMINMTDEDPPLVSNDLGYDGFTHNPFGRMIKLGVVFTPAFGG
ncbi:MAG: outer membrane receptor protein involved in Fe transport [Candidatus Azotimanducaceae bacterium]|jgi:outer membrane receptor protein involved in Fe transport